MQAKQTEVIRLDGMTPKGNGKIGIEQKTTNLATISPEMIEEKSVDLLSVNSEDFKDEDEISFSEGRLQAWNFSEFNKQMCGAASAIILLFGCGITSAWAIADLIKDIQQNEAQWIDIDYSFELFDTDEDEFLGSRHVIIGMVVLSLYFGIIIGAIFGAFLTPILPNKAIYALASVCMLFTGITLTKHTSPFYCAKSRLVVGLVFGLTTITLIVQAAESTTKKVRRYILITASYVSAIANLISALIFHFYDDRTEVTYTEENPALYIVSYAMIGCSIIALIVNLICTSDTVPFYLNRGEDTKAFKQLTNLKSEHLSMLDIRYEYERIRFDVAQGQLNANRNLASQQNHKPLITMCCVRILNLLFASTPMSLILIWDPDTSSSNKETTLENTDVEIIQRNTSLGSASTDEIATQYISPLSTLAVLGAFRLLCSLAVIIKQDKYHFNRFCYKLAFVVGVTLIIWFVARTLLDSLEMVQNVLFFPISIIIMMGFIGLPIPLDIIQLCQSADSYSRVHNTWSLAMAIFIENIIHIFLVIQLDVLFGLTFVYLVNGAAMIYFSQWLLKNMPNIVAIYPMTLAIVARYPFKNANESHITMHV